jgi:glycerol transport system ATP-binding protein
MFELRDISRVVKGQVWVHPTSLVLERGTMNVLLGATLSGKTSLMRLMAGLDQPSSGRLFWDGGDVTGQAVQERRVAMVYQQFINYPSMSVYDNIASPLRILGKTASEIDRAVRETSDMLKLTPYLDRKPLELSGGQQQRCALARALVKDAGLVLFDEPLANLDYKLREELRSEIPKIFEASGAIFVYATTEPEEALLLGGNTATLAKGRVTQFGPTPEVYRRPVDAVTARVFSDPPMNFIAAEKRGDRMSLGGETCSAQALGFGGLGDGAYLAGFRGNHLRLARASAAAIGFDCRVAASEITGSESFLHLDHAGARWVGLVEGVQDLAAGTALPVWVEPAHIYLFEPGGALVAPAAYALAS